MLKSQKGSISISSWITTPPKDSDDQGVARSPAALSCPLHTDFGIVDQSGRALVRGAYQKENSERCPHLRQKTRGRYPCLHRSAQPKSAALQMDEICRRNPGISEALLPQSSANIMQRTLDSRD